MKQYLDLFRISLKAHHDYLIKDIQNVKNQRAFSDAVHQILKHLTTIEELQSILDDPMDIFPQDRWWQLTDTFGHSIYAYEIALEIMTNLEERFTGTDRYPGPEFYANLPRIRKDYFGGL